MDSVSRINTREGAVYDRVSRGMQDDTGISAGWKSVENIWDILADGICGWGLGLAWKSLWKIIKSIKKLF